MVTYQVGSTIDKHKLFVLGWSFSKRVTIDGKEYEEWTCGAQKILYNQRKHSIKRIYNNAFVGYINHSNAQRQERMDREHRTKKVRK